MWPAYVTALFLLVAGALYTLTERLTERANEQQRAGALQDQARIAEGVERYIDQKGYPPASLDALIAEDGFEHLRGARNPWQRYERATGLNDGVWQFDRAASWTVFRDDGGATYRSENACGAGDVAQANSWCGAPDGIWHRKETRENFNEEIAGQRVRQMRTLQLFADSYTARQSFPSVGNDGNPLASGAQRSLASLAGFTGAATACSGVHVWQGIPLDCGALYDNWGAPVIYQYQSPTYIVLTTESPFRAADGSPVVVATPLTAQE